VARWAPLQFRICRPVDRRQVGGAQFGFAVLQEIQRDVVDRQVRVGGERGEGVGLGAEAVHQEQRQFHLVLHPQGQDLSDDDVQEGAARPHVDQ
jgi:hypothetical protein